MKTIAEAKSRSWWVGKRVRGWYPAPSISCEFNGGQVSYEGKIVGLANTPDMPDSLKFRHDSHERGDDYLCVYPREFTHYHNGGRWRKINGDR